MSEVRSTAAPALPVATLDGPRVAVSTKRPTPRSPGFREVLGAAAPIIKGAEAVASVLPGGPLVAAAIKAPSAMGIGGGSAMSAGVGGASGVAIPGTVAGVGSAIPGVSGGLSSGTSVGALGGSTTSAGGAADPLAGASTGSSGGTSGIESALADSAQMNLYYLQLQEQMAAENREYSTVSNVLKSRHDTVKNAIGNIR
jgi:hypothetical protein